MMKIEDMVFWALMVAIVAIALWLLRGSPPTVDALITLALFVVASELLIWKTIFRIDNRSTVGFMKVKHDIEKMRIEINNRFDILESKLDKGKK